MSRVPARSPQLLPPLAPALACPCRTPRALLVGDRPFRVVYRVRCMCTVRSAPGMFGVMVPYTVIYRVLSLLVYS